MSEILDAAAAVFAEQGYEKATTNAIAAAAGISPGSLYQFFRSKEAVAQALTDRFTAQMRDAHGEAFAPAGLAALAALDLDDLIDRVVDPLVAFNIANPGFKALFARPDMPPGLATAAGPIQSALLGRVEAILAVRSPGLSAPERARSARVLVQIFQAMTPVVVAAASEEEREAEVRELKKVLRGYLAPLDG
ncbi:TetR/AcrR family transcriptional regulator [Microbispora hainanensis]|uniref:TetR/AcrR family transcriptional regulator n=2 Tax=Microbispora hainanensis TaxID=568844 RepID=A0A544YZM1_9ACTN|nr:TetR/AcrR family transcriptional regulator [Microbispora hainanensis]